MRVVILSSWYIDVIGGSGTAVFFNALYEGLRGRGYEVEVISPTFDTDDYAEMTAKRFQFNAELAHDPRIQQADVLIGLDFDGYILTPGNRPPMITSSHAIFADLLDWETEPIRTWVERQAALDRVAMQRSDLVTIGSQYGKERIVSLYGIEPEKVVVIPHGMLPSEWPSLVDAEPRVENDHPVILSVGKMYPRKRTDILLRAVDLLRKRYPNVELRVIGDGIQRDYLHALAKELDISDNVTWLSHVTDDAAFAHEWRQADIFCHASSQETFGFVYLEAMMLGKAIVAANASAAPEVVGDGGLLVEPENPQAFADGLALMLENRALREAYQRRAKQRAPLFSHQRMIDGYVKAIHHVMNHKHPVPVRR
jgi:glycosyltransferase involved in cell wall biosynthesis